LNDILKCRWIFICLWVANYRTTQKIQRVLEENFSVIPATEIPLGNQANFAPHVAFLNSNGN
jgi:hypothetical protein